MFGFKSKRMADAELIDALVQENDDLRVKNVALKELLRRCANGPSAELIAILKKQYGEPETSGEPA